MKTVPLPKTDTETEQGAAVETARLLGQVKVIARWLDGAVSVPGTRFTFGLDAVIGLIPVAGDVFSAAMSSWLIWSAARIGAPGRLVARMFVNVLLDLFAGVIPVVGDLADVAFRANLRNLKLIESWLVAQQETEPVRNTGGVWLISLLVLVVAAALLFMAVGFAQILNMLILGRAG